MLMHSRLAPVQVATFGHTTTTGLPRTIMDYYVSHALLEMPMPEAQQYYTEELALLPPHVMPSFLEPRCRDGLSIVRGDERPFAHFTRASFLRILRERQAKSAPVESGVIPAHAIDGNWHARTHARTPAIAYGHG